MRWRRITPACAGKTPCRVSRGRCYRDHPRMCGKDIRGTSKDCKGRGSPPHVRERQIQALSKKVQRRITPACAGKTQNAGNQAERRRDHPRMCGKDYFSFLRMVRSVGSPPHVRERRRQFRLLPASPGITPACAGKTWLCE